MDNKERELIKYFVFIVIRRLEDERKFLGNPKIRFVFTKEDLLNLQKIVQEIKQKNYYYINIESHQQEEYLTEKDINNLIDFLLKNQLDYKEFQKGNYELKNDEFFIEIKDLLSFSKYLTDIVLVASAKYNITFAYNLLYSIWLRMVPSDILDINSFLKRQVNFLENDYLKGQINDEQKNIVVNYETTLNEHTWFETNQKIQITILNQNDEISLPIIHYAISKEDNKTICYLYAIQEEKDINLPDNFINEKRSFRNKYVKYSFLLTMKYFLLFLKKKGITYIKIPLLQVLDYDYHCNLSDIVYERFKEKYSKEKIEELEIKLSNNLLDDEIMEYLKYQKWYNHVFEKADTISKNKTERLVYLFSILEEKENLINILTEPFIEDEYLNIKIK